VEIASLLDGLVALADAEGGWAYSTGQAPHLEPTCYALLALSLRPERYREAIDKGLAFVGRCAGPDGAYRIASGRTEAVWPTAMVLIVQCSLQSPHDAITRTASRLLASRGLSVDVPAEQAAIHDMDIKIIGWPWAEGTFSWVDPTAWACLALRHAGYGEHPRVQEGQRLLLDRAFDEGGINYGNRKVFGVTTEPILSSTAAMLLALQGRDSEKRVAAAVEYLRKQAEPMDDLENLCWAKLALDLYASTSPDGRGAAGDGTVYVSRETQAALDAKIIASHQSRLNRAWTKPSAFREALAALALGCSERNVFRLPAAVAPEKTEISLPKMPGRRWKERLHAKFQSLVIKAVGAIRPLAPEAAVHIAKAADYNADLADIVTRQFEAFRERVVLKGKRVVIKPNLVEYRPAKPVNTHPNVVGAVIEMCKRNGASEVIVAEGPGHWRNVEHIVQASGLGDVLKHHAVPFVDINHDDVVRVLNMGRCTGMENLWLPRTVHHADVLISVAKLKTHHWAGVTLSLKNLFGIMPGICYGWPKNELHWRGIENSIIDIALTRTPDLAIIDGIVGMEGDGPLAGTAKELGVLVMGCDPMAVDATCCRLMKLEPGKVGYLQLGQMRKLGLLAEGQIKQLGETIAANAKPFETLPHHHELYVGRSA
jgi:uncharacterized protein (DUF362 family)